MRKKRKTALDFIIDRLTNSIQNTISGDSFQTEVSLLTITDVKQITRKSGWQFNWKRELADNSKEVYKLTIVNNPGIIQGLISLTIRPDHILMDLVERLPSISGKTNYMKGWQGILLLMPVSYHFSMALMDSFHLQLKPGLLSIIKKH